jgi:phage terminase large subunit-like protein
MLNSEQPLKPSEALSLAQQVCERLEMEAKARLSERQLQHYRPYPKQSEFHAAGKQYRERILLAGNQLGKTLAAGMELAMHATGDYPGWWTGRTFDKPINAWAAGVTGLGTRDYVQRILLGRPGAFGTGSIPKAALAGYSASRGVADCVDTIRVLHRSGGESTIALKSYEQRREKWQGETLDVVWFDEEPPEDIYYEGLTRTNSTNGMTFLTFTPLHGISSVVRRFLMEKPLGTHITQMTIWDAEHYSEAQREAIIASYPDFERDARTKGIPQLGSGRVFPIAEGAIKCESFQLPAHWPHICGIDFGWDHPSAAVRLAWDRDSDTIYVVAVHRAREQTPAHFSAAVRPWGDWLPWAWPHDGLQHDKGSGEQLAAQYRTAGLSLLPQRATFEDGSSGVEAGITDLLDRMQTGRFKVFAHLLDWWDEFNLYHRKDGLIVKENDDLMSATRYAVMMRRFAKVKGQKPQRAFTPTMARQGAWMG